MIINLDVLLVLKQKLCGKIINEEHNVVLFIKQL